jgi:hypothetical protein
VWRQSRWRTATFSRFYSERDRLAWLVDALGAHFERDWRPAGVTGHNVGVLMAASAWIRLALSYTKTVHLLIEGDVPDAIGPTERALVELWVDFSYLLEHGDAAENAVRVEIASVLELRAEAMTQGHQVNSEAVEGAERQYERLRRQHPALLASIVADRIARRFHWSGMTRTAIGKAVLGPEYKRLYGLLSWEAHAVMTAIRDYHVDVARGQLTFKPFESTHTLAESAAYRVGGIMYRMYNVYTDYFGLAPLVLPR